MKRANFRLVRRDPLTIRDLGPWNIHPTVTNDAEHVVASLVEAGELSGKGREVVLYYDSQNDLDRLVAVNGRFARFLPGTGKDE